MLKTPVETPTGVVVMRNVAVLVPAFTVTLVTVSLGGGGTIARDSLAPVPLAKTAGVPKLPAEKGLR